MFAVYVMVPEEAGFGEDSLMIGKPFPTREKAEVFIANHKADIERFYKQKTSDVYYIEEIV
jgi:hypothetical protein